MQDFEQRDVSARGAHATAPAETLLFTQYRCWMAGYSTRDITCWEIAWTALESTMGVGAARRLFGEFHGFVRAILETTRRDIGWRPAACRCLCPDEAVVLALLRASQQQRTGAELGFASDLLGHADCAALLAASRSLGRSLADHDLILPARPADTSVPASRQLH